jgi:probable rRNA maturation factor
MEGRVAKRVTISFRWQKRAPGRLTGGLRALAETSLRRLGTDAGEVGVLICDDATIRSLNRHFRHKDAATDVLSFPAGFEQPDGPRYIGDIAISLETAVRQADAAGVTLERELQTLLLHATIHLCGHDHETDSGEMAALEQQLRQELLP